MRTLTAMQDARRTNKEGRRRRVGSEFVGLSLSLSSDFYLFFSSVSKVIFFDHSWCRNNIIVSFQTEPTLKVLLISLKAGGWEMSEIEMTTWQLRWSQEKDSTCKQPIIFSSWTRGRELIVTQWSMPKAV